jgi:ubiquinone/menaquinone biosynthesis C-methylase UbiE
MFARNDVSPTLQAAYDEQYSDESTAWRELCARHKADNIRAVCAGGRFARVLECGAGEGAILKFLEDAGFCSELTAIEISDSGLRQIEKRRLRTLREARKFDGYQLPFPDDSFDLVYCSHVIEHVEHPRILLRELRRVAPHQVFEIPLDYAPRVDAHCKHYLSYGHINVFTPSTFRFLLMSEGFEILADRYTYNPREVIRFNWYKNVGMRRNWPGETKLLLWPLYRLVRRLLLGPRLYQELEFSAYTCLTRAANRPEVLGRASS